MKLFLSCLGLVAMIGLFAAAVVPKAPSVKADTKAVATSTPCLELAPADVVQSINAQRAKAGLGALTANPTLDRIAAKRGDIVAAGKQAPASFYAAKYDYTAFAGEVTARSLPITGPLVQDSHMTHVAASSVCTGDGLVVIAEFGAN